MLRTEFYTEIDDWLAYNFNLLGAPFPSKSFVSGFIRAVEVELAGYAKTDREQLMPWEQVGGREDLNSLLPIMLTAYLNERSAP